MALAAFFWAGRDGGEALAAAFSAGWAVSAVVYALSTAYYGFREKWGAGAVIRNRIKEHRARWDMTQEELAWLVGVRRETIGNLEKGRYNPSLVLAWNIAKVFQEPLEEVFTVEE